MKLLIMGAGLMILAIFLCGCISTTKSDHSSEIVQQFYNDHKDQWKQAEAFAANYTCTTQNLSMEEIGEMVRKNTTSQPMVCVLRTHREQP